MKITEKETKCPKCGQTKGCLANPVDDQDPEPGDIVLCHGCGTVCQFIDGFELKEVSEKGIQTLKDIMNPASYMMLILHRAQIQQRNETKGQVQP